MFITVKKIIDWEEHWEGPNEENCFLSGTVELTNGKILTANLFCESDDGIDMYRVHNSNNEQIWDEGEEVISLSCLFDIDYKTGYELWQDIFDALWRAYERSLKYKNYDEYSDRIFEFDDLLQRTGYLFGRCYYITDRDGKYFCVKGLWNGDKFEFAEITKEQYDAIDEAWNPTSNAVFRLIEDMELEFRKCRVR